MKEVAACLFLGHGGPSTGTRGCCVFLLSPASLTLELVFQQAGLTEVLEGTDKEVGRYR